MPFDRPTLSELITRVQGDFRTRLSVSGALVRRAMADVFAQVWAGTVHLTHGHLDWLAKQLFADTSIREYLIRDASMHGIVPTAATFAAGDIDLTGVNGSVIPIGTAYVRDDGATFTTTTAGLIALGVDTVTVSADLAGSAGNMASGDILSLESPITGVDTDADVDATGIIGGLDEESTEALRTRFLLRLQEPPAGGSDQDYEAWATAVAGVTRAWIYRHESGLGTLTVRFVMDDEVSIFPGAPTVALVQAALDADRPTTAEPTAAAPVDDPIAFTIAITPDTTATRAAVTSELEDLFYRDSKPGDGVARGTILLSAMQTAIGVADEITDYTLTVPAANVVPALGDMPTLGTITWV